MAVSVWSAPMTASTVASARLASTANVTDVAFAKAAVEYCRTEDTRRPSAKALHGSQPQSIISPSKYSFWDHRNMRLIMHLIFLF
uniref:Putative secreted protein n=1 Tax=Ixodes scapularis TaxID=6945 RepID=A0A4D5RCW6_IXOSC